jgi:hypothetical protein
MKNSKQTKKQSTLHLKKYIHYIRLCTFYLRFQNQYLYCIIIKNIKQSIQVQLWLHWHTPIEGVHVKIKKIYPQTFPKIYFSVS